MSDSVKFRTGQQVVYPAQGVGRVEEILEKDFKGQKCLYYVVYLSIPDMTVMIPVKKANELGLREIVSSEKSKEALEIIGKEHEPASTDWKVRHQVNTDLLKKGNVTDIAPVVASLYRRSKVKELPIQERKLYDTAHKLLVDEIALSLGKSKDEVEQIVHSKLESYD